MDISVHNYIDESRLSKLTSLQEKFLKHAMNAFPNVKRIVYSTCSMFHEENERVITNVVRTSRSKWRVQDIRDVLKGQWNNFGSAMYGTIGTRCLYAKPDTDFTTGFFLAVLDRDQKQMDKQLHKEGKSKNEYKNISEGKTMDLIDEIQIKNNKRDEGAIKNNIDEDDNNGIPEVPKKKNKKIKQCQDTAESNESKNNDDIEELKESSKKNKRRHGELNKLVDNLNELTLELTENETVPKKKSKKHKDENGDCNLSHADVVDVLLEDQEKAQNKKKRKKNKESHSQEEMQCDIQNEHPDKKKFKSEKTIEADLNVCSIYTDIEPLKDRKKKKEKSKRNDAE